MLDDLPTLEDGPEFFRELWRAFRRAVANHAGDGPGDLHQLALDVAGCSAELRANVDDTVYALSGRTLTSLVEQVQETAEDEPPENDEELELKWRSAR
jgi:hypothetical protein